MKGSEERKMGLKERLEALNPDAPVLRFINQIVRACPIKPSSMVRAMPTTRILVSSLTVSLVLAVVLAAAGPPPFPLNQVMVIDEDLILPNRAPSGVSPPPGRNETFHGGYYLEGSETLVIRDCTVYTRQFGAPSDLEVPYGGPTSNIVVRDFANLTMVNVRVVPSADITVRGKASVKMVNVTNWSIGWLDHSQGHGYFYSPQPGVSSLIYQGGVFATGNSTVWIENSRIAGVRRYADTYIDNMPGLVRKKESIYGYLSVGVNITVIDSWFADSRPYTALKANASIINKTGKPISWNKGAYVYEFSLFEFKHGEPISMNFTLQNVGDSTLNFSEFDRFYISAHENGTTTFYNNWDDPHHSKPIPSEYRFPTLKPGETFTQTLTWREPPLPPSTSKYWISGNLNIGSLDMGKQCSKSYVVTISEEKWQG